MPGFDQTGPRSMGPMTGGAHGRCTSYGRRAYGRGFFDPWFRPGRGSARKSRTRFQAPGHPVWSGPMPGRVWETPGTEPYNRNQEIDRLKEQAAFLEQELGEVNKRLKKIESQKP